MKRRLAGIADGGRILETLEGESLDALDGGAGFARRVVFLADRLARFIRLHVQRGKQVPVEPPEIAGDAVRLHDRLDAIDRRFLTFLKQPRGLFASQLDKFTGQPHRVAVAIDEPIDLRTVVDEFRCQQYAPCADLGLPTPCNETSIRPLLQTCYETFFEPRPIERRLFA